MANRKISQLPEATNVADNDIIPVVDSSEAVTKKVQVSTLLANQLTADERAKLQGIQAGATANQTDAHLKSRGNHTGTQTASTISDFDTEVANNSSVTANSAKVSADGSVTTHSDVTSAGSGQIITTTERNKLAGIASGATANASDANLKNRANHTGTQTLSTISDAGTSASLDVATTGDASASQVVKGNDSRLTDARPLVLAS